MKKRAFIPTPQDLWQKFENSVIRTVTLALQILRTDSNLPESENDITIKLIVCIHKAVRRLSNINEIPLSPPSPDALNQSAINNAKQTSSIKKRPDIQFSMYDATEPDDDKFAKHYTIECKRLGESFNEKYVTQGILRFISEEHSYAVLHSTGAMIGYVQTMELSEILVKVNDYAQNNSIPKIKLTDNDWNEKDVTRLGHRLDRVKVLPTPFDLRHLWIDLRQDKQKINKLSRSSKSKKKA